MTRPDTVPPSPAATGRWSSIHRWRPRRHDEGASAWRSQLDPGSGRELAEVLDLDTEGVRRHVERVRLAYDAGTVPTARERAELLAAVAARVEAAAADLGELDALCTGKLLGDATASAKVGAGILRYYAELLEEDPYSETPDSMLPGVQQIVDRVPVGLVACILPWNFPLPQTCARLAMLFAAGNAGVFKGSELAQPPLLALEELVVDAGLPDWAYSVVTGGPEAGRALVEAPEVDAICFTGGVPTGLAVAQSAMRDLKRIVLELGGKTPYVVFADADLDAALDVGMKAAFGFQGQACHAGSLVLVEAPVYERFLQRFAARAGELPIGHQLADGTEVGPLISAGQRDRVAGMVDEAVRAGARLHAGGEPASEHGEGFYYRPTVLSDVPSATAAATEEVFGPVVVAAPFADEEEIVARVNGSSFGLAATIWTNDRERVERLRRTLRTGQLYVNTHGHTAPNVPWGGFRLSGLGRLYGRDGLYAFTEARSTYVRV